MHILLALALIPTTVSAKSFPLDSKFLSPALSDVEIRIGEEYMGPTAFGRIKGSEIKELGRISTYPTEDATELSINEIVVEPEAQGKGVAHVLAEFALRRQEQLNETRVKKITASSYVGGNLDPALARLIHGLKEKKGFIAPDKSKSYSEQFMDCCSTIYKDYPEVLEKAVTYVPSFGMGRDLGFHLCPGTLEFRAIKGQDIYLNFAMCRE